MRTSILRVCRVVPLLMLACAPAAFAHPHSFITLKTEIIEKDGLMTGLRMRWLMDEITSADLLYDAGNARPGSEIWKKLAAEVMANVIGQHYFTEVWHDGKKVTFLPVPPDYGMSREGHQAVLTFTLPFAKPQPLAGQRFTFSTFDPSYYVDMSYEATTDVALPAGLTGRCSLSMHTPTPGADTQAFALSLDKEDAPPEDMKLGKQFAQKVELQCQ